MPDSFRSEPAQAIADAAAVGAQARTLLAPGMGTEAYARTLAAHGLYDDATSVLAHGLSDPAAVRWAAESARRARQPAPAEDLQALGAAESAGLAPTGSGTGAEALQGALGEARFQSAAAWAAQAAAWAAEGALLGPERLVPKAVNGAVRLAATLTGPAPAPTAAAAMPGSPAAPEAATLPAAAAAAPGVPASALGAAEQAALNDALRPFVDLGLQLALDALQSD